jgi:hypothetical protein
MKMHAIYKGDECCVFVFVGAAWLYFIPEWRECFTYTRTLTELWDPNTNFTLYHL